MKALRFYYVIFMYMTPSVYHLEQDVIALLLIPFK